MKERSVTSRHFKAFCYLLLVSGAALIQARLFASELNRTANPQNSHGTNRVTLNIAAFDSRGWPVDDLNSGDFQITDEGKPQTIVSFRRNDDAPALKGEASNPIERPALVILFDLLNANFTSQAYATEQIVHALEHLESSDGVYLYLLTRTGSLSALHALPAAEGNVSSSKNPWVREIRQRLQTAIKDAYGVRPQDERSTSIRVKTTYLVLDDLATKMAHLPGRKNIVWITQGVPLNVTLPGNQHFDYLPTLERWATKLDQSDISLHSVDQGSEPGLRSRDTLEKFATLTGGKIYVDIEKAISEVVDASRHGYLVEFAAPAADGKYHKIRVSCSRKGIRVQARQGYYAN
jgi:VWFA-related protein